MYANLCLLLSALSLAVATPVQDLQDSDWRLIKTGPKVSAKWMNQADILKLYQSKTKFRDVTWTNRLSEAAPTIKQIQKKLVIPTKATQMSVVKPLIAPASTDLMKQILPPLSKFNTRYYTTDTGKQSSDWLFGQVQSLITANNSKNLKVSVKQFKHSWVQNSIIARIEGLNNNQETVIVGAHQDSINQSNPRSGRAPGADDDGSGVVTILEAFRLLLIGGYQPLRPIEFHFYAGEEAGLLGSQAIAQQYQKDKRVVAGMMQLDMTSFSGKTKDAGIVTDYVDDSLTALVRSLVTTYTNLKTGDFDCGYACSDHASWNEAGYPSAIPFESSNMEENQYLHTPRDDLNTVDYDHGLNFAKITVAFVVEMSHQ